MSGQNHKISIKQLVALIGVASASVFLSVPALALINSKSSSFDGSLKDESWVRGNPAKRLLDGFDLLPTSASVTS